MTDSVVMEDRKFGILEGASRVIMGLGWGISWLALRLIFMIFGSLEFFLALPNHAYAMCEKCANSSPSTGVTFAHKRWGCASVLFFPLWFPFSVIMAAGHLFFSCLLLVFLDRDGAKFHFIMAEESFRF